MKKAEEYYGEKVQLARDRIGRNHVNYIIDAVLEVLEENERERTVPQVTAKETSNEH